MRISPVKLTSLCLTGPAHQPAKPGGYLGDGFGLKRGVLGAADVFLGDVEAETNDLVFGADTLE